MGACGNDAGRASSYNLELIAMRILFFSTTFPDATAPTRGTYNSALCRELAREHDVRAISPRTFTEAAVSKLRGHSYRRSESIQEAGIVVDYPTYWYTPKVWQDRSGDQMWWSVRRTVERAVREFQPEAVLSYWAHPDGEVGLRAARLAGVPCGVIVGGSDVLILPQLPKRGSRVREVLLQSGAVITVCEGLRTASIQLGVPADRVHTIYQGIETTVFHQACSRTESRKKLALNEGHHLLWVGRMHPIKALPILIEAVEILHQRGMIFQLHLVGDGSERGPIQQLVNDKKLSNVVTFRGAVGHDQIGDWYRACDLTVLSSDSEGLPNVFRESLACGTPFVSTDVGSVREIADDSYACLAPKRDPRALADAIARALDPSFREAAARYQPSSWADCAQEITALFTSIRQSSDLSVDSKFVTAVPS